MKRKIRRYAQGLPNTTRALEAEETLRYIESRGSGGYVNHRREVRLDSDHGVRRERLEPSLLCQVREARGR